MMNYVIFVINPQKDYIIINMMKQEHIIYVIIVVKH
jgi:hypothetical protein